MLSVTLDPSTSDRIWVFTHQAVILAFRVALEGRTEQEILEIDHRVPVPNCSTTCYRCDGDGRWRLEAFADTQAIEGAAPTTREQPAPDRVTDALGANPG